MNKVGIEVVDVRKLAGDGNLKAFADVKIADAIVVHGVTVVQGRRGVFVSMPRKAGRDGKWFDIFTPVQDDLKQAIESKVMEAYDRETDGVSG